MNIRNILVPTDFSSFAWTAVESAVDVARERKAKVHLLHVIDMSGFGPPFIPQCGFVYPRDTNEVYKLLDEVKSRFPDVEFETTAVMGQPAEEIVDYANTRAIDLICIGTRGRRGLPRHLLGSTTEKVVRLAQCPVLTMHGQTQYDKLPETRHAATA